MRFNEIKKLLQIPKMVRFGGVSSLKHARYEKYMLRGLSLQLL